MIKSAVFGVNRFTDIILLAVAEFDFPYFT